MPDLILYYHPGCPYCTKVFRYLNNVDLDVKSVDIWSDDEARQTLLDVGGKTQVPCLFIDGKPMYESDDIIRFLESLVS